MNKATSKIIEEKKQREHLLQLNQILAKQVMEMSKIVAGMNELYISEPCFSVFSFFAILAFFIGVNTSEEKS